MLFAIPQTCGRCKKITSPKRIRLVMWPLGEVMNGDSAWLCTPCFKDMQKIIKKWMKTGGIKST